MSYTAGFKFVLPLFIALAVSACGGSNKTSNSSTSSSSSSSSSSSRSSSSSSSSSGIPGPDTAGPDVKVYFPTPVTSTNGDKITLRGAATDQTGVAEILVNGMPVTTTDNFANWQFKVDNLQLGVKDFTVTAKDSLGHQAAEQVIHVKRIVNMQSPRLTVLDESSHQLYVYDSVQKAILAVDTNTGVRRIFSSANIDSDTLLQAPISMVLDSKHQRLLIGDNKLVNGLLTAVILSVSINPATAGERSIFMQGPSQTGPDDTAAIAFRQADGLAIDEETNKLYIYDSGGNLITTTNATTKAVTNTPSFTLSSVDLDTKAQTVISTSTQPNTDNLPDKVPGIRYDKISKRILYLTNITLGKDIQIGLYAFDATTGARTEVSGPKQVTNTSYANRFIDAQDFAVAGNYAWVANNYRYVPATGGSEHAAQIHQVDLTTGVRTALTDNLVADKNFATRRIRAINVDSAAGTLYLTDDSLAAIFALNMETQKKSNLASNLGINENTRLQVLAPTSLVLDDQTQRLYIAEQTFGEISNLNLANSTVGTLTSFGVPDLSSRSNTQVKDMSLDSANNRLLVIANYRHDIKDPNGDSIKDSSGNIQYYFSPALQDISLADGGSKLISGYTTPSVTGMVSLGVPQFLTYDPQRNQAIIYDTDYSNYYYQSSLIGVDLAQGNRTVVGFGSNLGDILWNPLSGLYFYLDTAERVIYSQALGSTSTSSQAQIFSQNASGQAELFKLPKTMAADTKRNRVILVDNEDDRILALDGATGARKLLVNSASSNGFNRMRQVSAMAYDQNADVAYVADTILHAIIAVDLTTGERTIVSQ